MNTEMEYRGCLNARIPPELHKAAVIAAMRKLISRNRFAENAIANAFDAR